MRDDNMLSQNNLRTALQMPFILRRENGIILMTGTECPDLLNRLSTNKTVGMKTGDVVETILTTEKGRIIDVLHGVFWKDEVILVTSNGKIEAVLDWLNKYTIMEDVRYYDISSKYSVYWTYDVYFPEQPDEKVWQLLPPKEHDVAMTYRHASFRGPGKVSIVTAGKEQEFLQLYGFGTPASPVRIATEAEYQLWRIKNGFPEVGTELTELVNPLEAGAASVVDFEKGCYIGQEVIARLDSYDKVQRTLVRFTSDRRIPEAIEPGTAVESSGKNAGFITSAVFDPHQETTIGLGCIRRAYADPETRLEFRQGNAVFSLIVQ